MVALCDGKISLFMGHQGLVDPPTAATAAAVAPAAAAVATANAATTGGLLTLSVANQPYLKVCTHTGETGPDLHSCRIYGAHTAVACR